MSPKRLRRMAALLAALAALTAAVPIAAQAKQGADDPPEVQPGDGPGHH